MKHCVLMVVALAATVPVASAQESLSRTGSGARAAGMGNAFIAVSDDGTAASWNPAGLAQLREAEFSLVHNTGRRNRHLEGFRTFDRSAVFTTLSAGSTSTDVEFASGAVPFRVRGRPVTVQVGWRRLYDLGARWNGDQQRLPVLTGARPASSIRTDATTDGGVTLWSFAGAVGVTNRLSVGWSLDAYRTRWADRANFSESPGAFGPADFVSAAQTNRLTGNAFNLGLLLAYPSFSVGLVYHGPLRGDFSRSLSLRSNLLPSADVSEDLELRFPRSIGAGVAWRPRPLLRLAVDVTYNEWTKFLVHPVSDVGGAVSFFDDLPPELSATRDTVSLNVGMEKLFPVTGLFVPLRLGAAYEPQGARDLLAHDGLDYAVLAAGTGINTNSVKFDVALEHLWGSIRNSDDVSLIYRVGRAEELGLPPGPEAQGTVRLQQWRLKVSMIYRLTNTARFVDFVTKVLGS